jgi:hypothetical protein
MNLVGQASRPAADLLVSLKAHHNDISNALKRLPAVAHPLAPVPTGPPGSGKLASNRKNIPVRQNRIILTKVVRRELDNLSLIFNNEVVLRAAGNEILRSAEANTLT